MPFITRLGYCGCASTEADIGIDSGSLFDDDLFCATLNDNSGAGGADTILGADNDVTLIGHVVTVAGGESGSILIDTQSTGGSDGISARRPAASSTLSALPRSG